MKPHLFIGNLNYSSWSLRSWLALRWAGIEFDETLIELDQPGYGEGSIGDVVAVSPSGRLPVLNIGNVAIWDSLAIAEWAAENSTTGPLLPDDPLDRAQMRSVVAEMHSGFAALRRDLPMNIRRRCVARDLPKETAAEIGRIDRMWAGLRSSHAQGGPWLFGRRSLADAFYLPVVTRLRTYAVTLSPDAHAYCETALADPAFADWERKVLAQPDRRFSRAPIDDLYRGGG